MGLLLPGIGASWGAPPAAWRRTAWCLLHFPLIGGVIGIATEGRVQDEHRETEEQEPEGHRQAQWRDLQVADDERSSDELTAMEMAESLGVSYPAHRGPDTAERGDGSGGGKR